MLADPLRRRNDTAQHPFTRAVSEILFFQVSRTFKIWMVTVGEPVPFDEGGQRLMRTGLLSEYLAGQGHEILWWTSTFDHFQKKQRFSASKKVSQAKNFQIWCLHGHSYKRNLSLTRILNHHQIAKEFRKLSQKESAPDVIVCSMPTIELTHEASLYAKKLKIPLVVDIRDLWPDIYKDYLGWSGRILDPLLFNRERKKIEWSLRSARSIVGVNPKYVEWGLQYAKRSGTTYDKHFWLLHDGRTISESEKRMALERWSELGVSRGAEKFKVCFVGTLSRKFDWKTVAQAAEKLQAQGEAIQFILCGEGEFKDFFIKHSKKLKNITVAGWINRSQMGELLRMSDAALAPYLDIGQFHTGVPTKVFDYWAYGLPIITSVTGELGRVLKTRECGVVYKQGDSESLVQKIIGLRDNASIMEQMKKNTLQLYETEFSERKTYTEFERHLSHVLS